MDKFYKTILAVFVASLFLVGISLLIASFFPMEKIKIFFDSMVSDGNFESFSSKQFLILRLTGISISAVGVLLYIFRTKFLQYLSEVKIIDFLINPKEIICLLLDFIRDFNAALKKEDKTHMYSFIMIFSFAVGVRIYYLFQPMITDEITILETRIYHAVGMNGLIQLISHYDIPGNHIFHTILAYLSYKLVGSDQSVWIIRLPALFAGILLVPATYMVVRIFYNKHSALIATSIISASSPIVYYSTKARGYTMICLFFLLIFALMAYLKKNNNLAGWHLFAILSAFGFYTMPIMLWPYGIVIAWLLLSIIFKDTHIQHSHLLKNLLISIVITILLTFLLYSPVIFAGTGLKSFIAHPRVKPVYWVPLIDYINNLMISFQVTWKFWTKNMPDIINLFSAAGFFISLLFHNKFSPHRINPGLAAIIWLIPALLLHRVIPNPRAWLFLLPLFIGLASSGFVYLFKSSEKVFRNYISVFFAVVSILLSIVLIGNKVQSESYLPKQLQFIDKSGKYVDFSYVMNSLNYHMIYDQYGMNLPPELYRRNPEKYNKTDTNPRILSIFSSPSQTTFWSKGISSKMTRNYIVSDLNTYLSKESRTCNSLFLLSNEPVPEIQALIEKRGLLSTDYTVPKVIHRYNYATLYKTSRVKDCRKYNP